MNAATLVRRILEMEADRADSDPSLKPSWPRGFIATAPNGDVIEVRLTLQPSPTYRVVKYWNDDYTGQRRSTFAGLFPAQRTSAARIRLQNMKRDYLAHDWKIVEL